MEGNSVDEEEAERARRQQIFRPAYVHLIQNIMGRGIAHLPDEPIRSCAQLPQSGFDA